MARKSAVLLKSAVITLPSSSVEFLEYVNALPVPDNHEAVAAAHKRYVDTARKLEEQWVRVDVLAERVDKQGSNDPEWGAYLMALRQLADLQSQVYASCITYMNAIEHMNDAVLVAADEVRSIVGDSLADKLDELEFSVNYGLLASKVALAIRKDAIEGVGSEPPFCKDCDGA